LEATTVMEENTESPNWSSSKPLPPDSESRAIRNRLKERLIPPQSPLLPIPEDSIVPAESHGSTTLPMPLAHTNIDVLQHQSLPNTTSSPQIIRMPEPQLPAKTPRVDDTQDFAMSERSVPLMQPSIVAMPEPTINGESIQLQPAMPIPSIPSYSYQAEAEGTPRSVGVGVMPETTYDPASLQAPEWTSTQTPHTIVEEEQTNREEKMLLERMKQVLKEVPQHLRTGLHPDELIQMMLRVVDADGEKRRANERATQSYYRASEIQPGFELQFPEFAVLNPDFATFATQLQGPEWTPEQAVSYLQAVQAPATLTDNEWYHLQGGGTLPSGEY
jgi:hypothetical protein